MFIFLYRWRIKSGLEQDFVDGWAEITEYYLKNFDSLGSRLHRGDDGIWYAYAQWKTKEQRDIAFQASPKLSLTEKMKDSIEERLPEVKLEVKSDFLQIVH